MKNYNVYTHPMLGYEVIKDGFSWPGFFFTWIWAFVKKLWVHGSVLIPAVLICNTIPPLMVDAWNGSIVFVLLGLCILIAPMLITGLVGNNWREESMLRRGYKRECTVIAASSDGAMAEAAKPREERRKSSLVREFEEIVRD